jgi:glucose/arabinose dehydrogenase
VRGEDAVRRDQVVEEVFVHGGAKFGAGPRLAAIPNMNAGAMRPTHPIALIAVLALGACSEMSRLPDSATTGPNPTLPEPTRSLIGLAMTAEGAYVGQHGSWNRRPPSGYNVVFIPFRDGRPSGPPVLVLEGFLDGKGNAYGRPVGVAIDKRGALLVADDVGNAIWRVTVSR